MAQITLADLTTYVQDFIPDKPTAKVGRAANLVLQKIARYVGQYERTTITTKAQISTGTVSAASGSVGVTFSSAVILAADPVRLVQISGSDEWYTLTRTSDTIGILSSTFSGTTGATLTYKIVYPVVTFPSAVLQINKLWQEGYEPLSFASNEHRQEIMNKMTPGRPSYWAPYSPDAAATPNDSLRLQLIPPPDTSLYTYQVSYRKRPTLFTVTDGTTTANIPEQLNEALLAGTLWYCWDQEDKEDRSKYWKDEYNSALREALGEMSSSATTQAEELTDASGLFVTEARPTITP